MNFIRTFLNCCAGFQFYRNLLSLHPLQSIRFLASVILLVVIIQIGTFVPVLKSWLDAGATWVQVNLPRFEIKNGQAHYDGEQPFVFTNKDLTIQIDTTGSTNAPEY